MEEPNNTTYIQESGNSNVWESVTNLVDPQGEITITEIDEANSTISGTFNFTGHNPINSSTKEFTNGSFINIPLNRLPDIFENEFFAKVDGVEYVETSISPINRFGHIFVGGRRNLEILAIIVDENVTAGTYTLTSDISRYPNGVYEINTTDLHVSGSGTITITSHDVSKKRLIGTFEFIAVPILTGVGTYEITEGSFSVTYTN